MFSVYHSNQLDILKSLLAALIKRNPLSDPFMAEQILVQSPGMAQWLKQQLALEFGVAARLEFPLPSSYVWGLFAQVLPHVPVQNPYTKSAMAWRLMDLLPSLLALPEFAPLAVYLEQDEDARKRYQLSQRIADVFDQYLVYRPDWIADWESGGVLGAMSQPWQPILWRALVAATEQQALHIHRANLFDALIQALDAMTDVSTLPKRLFVFGITSLPPHYLKALAALGQHIDVHVMLTNPCRHYWGDLTDDWRMNQSWLQQLLAQRRAYLDADLQPSGEHLLIADAGTLDRLFSNSGDMVRGNPLLVSMGKQGRDYHSLLVDLQPNEFDAFVDIEPRQLLGVVQSDVLELNDRGREGERLLLQPDDDSLVIHACHSPMREIEVLHDALLARFAADPALKPRDVVVMVADINSYSPFIQAVFGSALAERHIPFSISDRSAQQESPLLQSFLTLLHLPDLRCSAPELVTLLAVPEVMAAQGLDEAALLQMQGWVRDSGIRWGLDPQDAERFDLQQMPANTWQDGMQRMLLGFAMATDAPFAGILPYREIEGQDAQRLGRLSHFLTRLRWLRDQLPQERSVDAWSELVDLLLLEFYLVDEEGETQLEQIRQAMARLREQLHGVGYVPPLSLAVLRDYLQGELTNQRSGQQFLAGRVNFCTLMPMRSIPFKVVCLLGMNDGVYPRAVPPLGFDLMAEAPRRGDRSRREDDRYLFLEALLAAEQHLHISYVAHSAQDNSEKEPSVLVAELLDYCESAMRMENIDPEDELGQRAAIRQRLIREQALVPYDGRYFHVHAPDSYAAEWSHTLPLDTQLPSFFDDPLPLPEEWYQQPELELADLLRFFRQPVAGFFERTLRVRFQQQDESLAEDEPFAADALQGYLLKQELLEACLQALGEPEPGEQALDELKSRLRLSGQLPVGAFGDLLLEASESGIAALRDALAPLLCTEPSRQLVHLQFTDLELPPSESAIGAVNGPSWLFGAVSGIHGQSLVRYRPGAFAVPQLMRAWIEHLAWCSCANEPPEATELLGLKERYQLAALPATQARIYLAELMAAYLVGLTRPLPLLLRTGWVWLQQAGDILETGPEGYGWQRTQDPARLATAAQKMQQQFEGDSFNPGEGEDVYIRRVFPRWSDSLQQEVCGWSERLLAPLYTHLEAVK
jgi:exodeoxyribonuclease V gamma subunit